MKISAKVIEDSISFHGVRLTTMVLTYPRFIHSELMTHRVFSRNAMSSRAVPVAKMIEQVREHPAMPIHFGKNQPGMQAREELSGTDREDAVKLWLLAAYMAAAYAEEMEKIGVHKQVVNRILEPYQWMHTIVTATEWENFFELRLHEDAEPNFQALAQEMHKAMQESSPNKRSFDRTHVENWHLPFVVIDEWARFDLDTLKKVSAARCARVSYLTHEGQTPDPVKDLALYDRLVGSKPLHASPIEHQACPAVTSGLWSNNFRGWRQYRAAVEAATPKQHKEIA